MLIGIDFDNTIVDYNEVFVTLANERMLLNQYLGGGRQEVRDQLLARDLEFEWRDLQAAAYGNRMNEATIMSGFLDFIVRARSESVELKIVSHKTLFSNLTGKGTNFRHAALQWMTKFNFFQDLGFKDTDIYFEDTRDAKIDRITALECSHFIDDLEEVLCHPSWPSVTARLLFANESQLRVSGLPTFPNWNAITNTLWSSNNSEVAA